VTAITSIFLHREVLPFYMVLAVGVFAFAFGYFLAFGDELLEYRNPFQASKHVILLALLGENLPGEDDMESANFLFYIVTLLGVTFVLVLIMMNIFIAVVSEVYVSAVEKSLHRFSDNLDMDRFHKIHPKLSAQAESFLLHGYHKVLRREVQEQIADCMPSNSADVQELLQQLSEIKVQLDKSMGRLGRLATEEGEGVKEGETKAGDDHGDDGIVGMFFDTQMASEKHRARKRARDKYARQTPSTGR
jgi:hypothetical protein